jgi:diaminopimelate epimerase
MKLQFAKYHGTGNDFIVLDNRENEINLNKDQIAFLCHRKFGIGADGLLILGDSENFDFSMRYFNSDGGEGTMCGNGGRCITAFAQSLGIIENEAKFSAIDGEHFARIGIDKENSAFVSLKMSDVSELKRHNADFVINTGSPHLIRFVPQIEGVDVYREGKALRWDNSFKPSGINVNFVEFKPDHLVVRSFERGVEDITLSCGTGVTASAIAASTVAGKPENQYNIITDGGKLSVKFTKMDNHFTNIWLEGPAIKVFEGIIEL